MTTLATCWNMTINNPDENDYRLIRSPNEQFIRHLIWQSEIGENGTPHIQGYVKLMRQQRLSFVKKLFPRAHWTAITNDEYNINSQDYAQKEETGEGTHVHNINPQIPDVIGFLQQMLEDWVELHWEEWTMHSGRGPAQWIQAEERMYNQRSCFAWLDRREREAIEGRPYLVKLVLSPMYAKAKRGYWKEILTNRIQYKQDADDDEREGTGESELHEGESTSSPREEEEDPEGGSETDQSSDSGSEQDSQQED